MRSRPRLEKPASRARATQERTSAAEWMRPRRRRDASSRDWAPRERRFTPAWRRMRALEGERVPGLASQDHSERRERSTRERTESRRRERASSGRAVGVPPPKKTEEGRKAWGREESSRSTPASHSRRGSSRRGTEKKAQ